MTEIISDQYLRARKAHVCSWHPYRADEHGNVHSIEPGEVYRRTTMVDCGSPYTWKACAYHDAAGCAAIDLYGEEELNDIELTDQLYEWWGEAVRCAERGLPYPMPFNAVRTYEDRLGANDDNAR